MNGNECIYCGKKTATTRAVCGSHQDIASKQKSAHEAAQRLAEALAALKFECETNSDFATEPNKSEAVALQMADAALAEWKEASE